MAKVSLRIYNREIERLIEQGQIDQAIAHCRHILKTFSKHLETYRLLGKAYLESKRYKEAVDIFQRVLLSVPDDFVSHVGMSIISDEQNRLDDAIWHMQNAFEVQPSNAAIQGELQRLFGRRDGVEPAKIRLTRGALAHMYVQGELYTQAIAEIRAVLDGDAQRTDMQVLLAKAYFRNGQKTEATDLCSQLLRRFPFCFEANRIMVEILPGTQRAESTQVYRHRVSELDPYAAFAQDSIFRSDEVADAAVSLERFEYTGDASDSGPNWGQTLGLGLESDAAVMESASSSQPDWLKAASAPPPEPAPASPAQENIPDFIRQAGWSESSGQFEETPAPFDNESDSSEAVQADLPDWVKAMAPANSAPSVESSPAPQPAPSPETPDWLKDLGAPVSSGAVPAAQMSQDVPDWLKGLDEQGATPIPKPVDNQPKSENPAPPQPAQDNSDFVSSSTTGSTPGTLGDLGTSSKEQDDAMAWLEGLASKHGAKAEELVTDPNARTEVAPDWVDKAKAIGEAPPVEQPAAPSADETGMWLRSLEQSEADANVAKQNEPAFSETPDWLSGLSPQDAFTNIEAAPEIEETPMPAPDSAPDWLSELGPVPTDPAGARQDVPDWLHGSSSQPASPEPAASQDFSFDPNSAAALPDWLAGLDKNENEPRPTEPRNDLPSWLQNDAEPETTEPANPADWHPVEAKEPLAEPVDSPRPSIREMDFAYEEPKPSPKSAPKPEKKAAPRLKQTSALQPRSVDSLFSAQAEMGRGNISTALEVYSKLIRKGKFLEEIIRDLRDALYRYPVEVAIWQALGDAYMRGNRLQEALDAYTKAEELLR